MKPSFELTPSSSMFQQSPPINRQQANLNESYQALTKGVSIALTTREGDKITISQQSAASHYRKESVSPDSYQLNEQSIRLESMGISVQGDLNQQELDDLSKLFDDLGSIANEFFSGNLGGAVSEALNIGDMGSISQLEATFTRTSILSNYLSGPHPLPTLNQGSNAPMANVPTQKNQGNNLNDGIEPRIIDIMEAQWKQFLEALDLHRPEPNSPQKRPPASPDMVAREMLERAKETASTHPRITPLLPSVIDLALGNTSSQYRPPDTAALLAKSTTDAFNSLFSSWIL